ncbi:anaerobic ribonucleoside-triphosphate reductase activating protein [Fusibacter ferrireducens]|uniref:Anaerobic ribonucleoside-triphosphate reductase activating protein n=1 Tax=Fusibacter ferrireducens TaxID=2785058 RepID=A0ABR9ZY12_9FIRM|nr:anaerobic ribonucleoside-triphosphate reductase activating protein [Fusibacter ferrireducens]MBF4695347.1 anaerobic ribonucleoside-triphosphate reductase activating protein [Fusibacter ferrireducens]
MSLEHIKLESFLKTSFIDYPDLISSVAYFGKCNFRCPYCHNGDLVRHSSNSVSSEEWLAHIKAKRGLIDGVVISGGEPSLTQDIRPLLEAIRKLSVKIKIDTNGSNPEWLENIIGEQLVDYVAMDLKNTPSKYEMTAGLKSFNTQVLFKSIDLIIKSGIAHEFRTTLMKEFHELSDLIEMATLINGSKVYTLQQYEYNPKQVVDRRYTPYTLDEMNWLKDQIQPLLKGTHVQAIGKY